MFAGGSDDGGQGAGGGSILTRKAGPLPMWAWMGLGLGGALAYVNWRQNKQSAASNAQPQTGVQEIGGDQQPPVVFQSYTTLNTPITVPPGAGRDAPPVAAPLPAPAPTPTPSPAPTVPGPAPIPPQVTPPAPAAPPAPSGTWVTVAKYTTKNPPWNSTLWGIAKQYGYGAASGNWVSIWNNPNNSALKARRKQPTLIQPGDRIYVPAR